MSRHETFDAAELAGSAVLDLALEHTSTLPSEGGYAESADRPATEKEWAAAEFEPIHLEGQPPTNAEWSEMANPYLVSIRIAWVLLRKTKAELVQCVRDMGDDLAAETYEHLKSASGLFQSYSEMLVAAETRLLCAGAVILDQQESDER